MKKWQRQLERKGLPLSSRFDRERPSNTIKSSNYKSSPNMQIVNMMRCRVAPAGFYDSLTFIR